MTETLRLEDASDLWEAMSAFAPTETPRVFLWSEENIVTDLGKPYDHDTFPHIGAPGGPMDAFDDYMVREIWLQWASRLGKTFFGQICTIYNGVQLRLPQIFGSTNEKLALDVVKRTYKMLRQVPELNKALVKPERLQSQHVIEFMGCQVNVGWARSAATFADKDCFRGHKNELDDWTQLTTSKDGDPSKQFDERFKNHQGDRKVIGESIPKIKGKSRVEAGRLSGWNCEFHVPCPHCKKSQQIELGDEKTEFGIKFVIENKSVKDAWYQCSHCHKRIENHERAAMMRRGVWIPEGCGVEHDAVFDLDVRSPDYQWKGWSEASWVTGKPLRDNDIASYRLASFCSLKVSWLDCANEFWISAGKPQKFRNFWNQWAGFTWEVRKSKSEPEIVAARCAAELHQNVVPEWASFLTLTMDRQKSDGGFVPWVVLAHHETEEMPHVISWGVSETLQQAWEQAQKPYYKLSAAESGLNLPLYIEATAIDSGWSPKQTYEFCQDESHPSCTPCKGGNSKNAEEPYKWTDLDDAKHDTEGLELLLVSTNYTEDTLQNMLDNGVPGTPNSLGLCIEAAKDMDFVAQLTNMTLSDKLGQDGEPVQLWVKKDEATPNDFRDCIRYGIALGQAYRDLQSGSVDPDSRVSVEQREDGRDWND